ncbi:probable G-protein coupled receptor 139 [Heptranchias perlo]|uniref:probable G-protein coupled receptor 139 n=1 Tax=Heptranchias perlo TaxID=212740 RepID=UPI00355A0981
MERPTILRIKDIYYPVLASFGFPANLVTIVILFRGKCGLSKCISIYMVAMATADLLVIIFNVIERWSPHQTPLPIVSWPNRTRLCLLISD